MLAAVNSKHGRYDPLRYMLNGRGIKAEQRAKTREREPMTGDALLRRIQQLGIQVIDNRKRDGI